MNKRIFFATLIFGLIFSVCLSAQTGPRVKYWITFKDKTGTPYSLSNPSAFLSQKSITRRTMYNIPYHSSDLPVNPSYIKQVDTTRYVDVVYASKWLNGVVIVTDSSRAKSVLTTIKSYPFVADTNKVKRYMLHVPPVSAPNYLEKNTTSSAALSGFNFGGANGQAKQLGVNCMHESGNRGQGITIAVLDVGFNTVDSSPIFDSLRSNAGILGGMDFVEGGRNPYRGGTHGTMVMSCLAGNKNAFMLGTAPLAKYWLLRTEDGGSETITEEYNWIRGAEFADSVGVDMMTTSLGYTEFDIPSQNHNYAMLNGRTAPMSIAATMAARKGIFVLNAAGNDGDKPWHYVGVPADADSICTVGAVDTVGIYAPFSSVGPTADGRIKPDLVATGWGAWICDQSTICYPGNGTSFATPILAGAVACFWQFKRDLNNIQLLNEIKSRSSNAASPNNKIGWGIPKLCRRNNDLDFKVGYNSNTSILTITLSESLFGFVKLKVYDMQGKLLVLKDIDVNSTKILLNTTIAAEGLYLVTLETSKGKLSKKFFR